MATKECTECGGSGACKKCNRKGSYTVMGLNGFLVKKSCPKDCDVCAGTGREQIVECP